jgi:hypothetical protein
MSVLAIVVESQDTSKRGAELQDQNASSVTRKAIYQERAGKKKPLMEKLLRWQWPSQSWTRKRSLWSGS